MRGFQSFKCLDIASQLETAPMNIPSAYMQSTTSQKFVPK